VVLFYMEVAKLFERPSYSITKRRIQQTLISRYTGRLAYQSLLQ